MFTLRYTEALNARLIPAYEGWVNVNPTDAMNARTTTPAPSGLGPIPSWWRSPAGSIVGEVKPEC